MSTDRKPKRRKTISLGKKIEILDKLKSGQGSTSIAKEYGLNEATVRTIKRMEDSIRKSVARGTAASAKLTKYHRHDLIEAVERALVIWIEDSCKKKLPVDSNLIRHKAINIYNSFKDKIQTPSTVKFTASKGWFIKFKRRHNLHYIQLKGEITCDEKSAKEYPEALAKIIEENSYYPDQVFNANETGLYWKKMPSRTYLSESEKSSGGFKAAKNRVTLLLCSNASGDRLLKPLLIDRTQRPRGMTGKNMEKLPVNWRYNKKAWMTCGVFEDWFHNCFIPEVKSYLEEKNLAFKVLLLLDNSPSHPVDLKHPNVQIEFLPPNTVQPQDNIIPLFKAYYIRRNFADILKNSHENPLIHLTEVWKNFTILNCITNIASAVAEMKKSILNTAWKDIWPEVIVERNMTTTENIYSSIIDIAHSIGGEGFNDLGIGDIEELFENEHISDGDLVELVLENVGCSSETDNNFTGKVIAEGLRLGRELENYFLDRDPDTRRALKFQRAIRKALSRYEVIYKNICQNNQTLMSGLAASKSFNFNNQVGNIAGISITEASPVKNEFSVNDSDGDVSPVLPKKMKIVGLQSPVKSEG